MFKACIAILCLINVFLAASELKDSCDCCCAIDHLCADAVVKTKCQKTCAPTSKAFKELNITMITGPTPKPLKLVMAEKQLTSTLKLKNENGKMVCRIGNNLRWNTFNTFEPWLDCIECRCIGSRSHEVVDCRMIPGC